MKNPPMGTGEGEKIEQKGEKEGEPIDRPSKLAAEGPVPGKQGIDRSSEREGTPALPQGIKRGEKSAKILIFSEKVWPTARRYWGGSHKEEFLPSALKDRGETLS